MDEEKDEMNGCDQFEGLLPLHAIEETSVEEALRVEEHVRACASCRTDLQFYETVCATARNELTAVPPAPPALPRRRKRPEPPAGWGPRRAAAAVLLAIGLSAGLAIGWLGGRWVATPVPPVDGGPSGGPRTLGPTGQVLEAAASRGLPLSVFSPLARAHLSKVARPAPGVK